MPKIETWFTQDLSEAVKPRSFPGSVFNNDSLGNLIGVEVIKYGEPFVLTGSVNGYCVLSNGETIPVAGTRSGNKASIVLPQTAYSVRGVIKITLKLTDGDEITTLLQVVGAVDQSVTGNMVNPGSVVQDWSQQIAAALQELQDAQDNFVRVDTDSQGLTETQKNNGRNNIDAASIANFNELNSAIKVDSDMFMDSQKGAFDLDIVWEIGTYDNFQPVDLNTRCRSVRAHTVPGKYAYITLPEGLRMFVLDKTDQSSSTITASGPFVFNDSHEYYFAVRHYPTNTAFTDTSEAEAIKITFASAFETIKDCVDTNNYSTILPDANSAPANTLYRFFLDTGVTSYTANLPDIQERINLGATFALLETIGSNAHNCYLLQRFYTDNDIWQRYKLTETGTYTSWVKFSSQYMQERKPYIRSTNVSTRLSDLNNADVNRYYICYLTASGDKPANLPFTVTRASIVLVMTYGSETYRVQMCQYNGQIWHREYVSGTWTTWINTLDPLPKTFTVGASDSLASVIETAIKTANSTVYVSGEHDILSEYQALHPDDWDTRNDGRGINLNNGIKLIFNSGASVVCNYTGSDENVMTSFSALNVRYGSAEIINAKITAKNVKYCVHDDMWTSSSPYHVLYKDCIMDIDNSGNPYTNKPHCIGGGFGKSGHIDIENCVFTGKGATNPAPDDNGIVSWHNGPNASQYSVLTMTGCYFTGTGTFRVMSNGAATEKSKLIISNNSFGSAIVEGFENGASVDNIDIIAFDNEVRSAVSGLESAPAIIEIASGAIASFDDGADDRPVKSLVAHIEPVQDLHGYDHPWPAGGGKNLFDKSAVIVGSSVNGSGAIVSTSWGRLSDYIPVAPSTTYYISHSVGTSTLCAGGYYNANKEYLSIVPGSGAIDRSGSITTPAECAYVRLNIHQDCIDIAQFELGSTATDYAPYSNICPISGWTKAKMTRTGKNLLVKPIRVASFSGVTFADCFQIKAGTYRIHYNVQNATSWRLAIRMYDKDGNYLSNARYAPILNDIPGAVSYYQSYNVWMQASNVSVSDYKIVFSTDCYVLFFVVSGDTTSSTTVSNAQLELGSTATDYEPYSGNTYDITFPSEAGTVYGGTLDVGTGVLTVDRVYHKYTSEITYMIFGKVRRNFANGGVWAFSINGGIGPRLKANSSSLASINTPREWSQWTSTHSSGFAYPSDAAIFVLRDSDSGLDSNASTDEIEAAFNAYVSKISPEFCCYLQTPVTYTLTAPQIRTLLGTNNVWADTGDSDATYQADTKLYIDNKFTELQAIILENIGG